MMKIVMPRSAKDRTKGQRARRVPRNDRSTDQVPAAAWGKCLGSCVAVTDESQLGNFRDQIYVLTAAKVA